MDNSESNNTKRHDGCLRTLGIILITVIISVVTTVFVVNHYLFPSKFNAVELNQREELTLNKKLKQFGLPTLPSGNEKNTSTHTLESEAYSEEGAKEREFNNTRV